MTRQQRNKVAYIVILIFSAVMLIWAIPTYTPPYPGYGASPALVPNVSVGIIVVMSILALGRNVLAKRSGKAMSADETEFGDDAEAGGFTQVGRISLVYLGKFIVPCALLIIGIEYIGYLPAAFLFMLVIQFVIGSRKMGQSVVVAVAAVGVMYVTMRYGFGVPIPGPQLF